MNGPSIAPPPLRLAAPVGALVVWVAFGLATRAGAGLEQPSVPRGNRVAELKLKNGSMEQGDAIPLGWRKGAAVPGVRYVWDRSTGHDSKASLRLHKTVQRFFPIAQWYQIVPNPGTTSKLKVSAWVKAERASKGIVDVLFFGQDGKMTHQWIAYIGAKKANQPPVSHDWKEYSGVAEIPPGTTRLGVALQIYGPGKIWFDDVRAEFVSDETPKTDAVQAKAAEQSLQEHGADVRFNTYEGGHGWRGDVYGRIRNGIEWLDKQTVSDK